MKSYALETVEGYHKPERSQLKVEVNAGTGKPELRIPERVTIMPNTVTFHRPMSGRKKVKPGKRGEVNGLSPAAARRCKRAFINCPQLSQGHPDWVDLTYPGKDDLWPRDGRVAKKHLHTFSQWMRDNGYCGAWVLEYQTRGAPHFHLIVQRGAEADGNQRSKDYRAWRQLVARRWWEIVGSGDADHLKAGTRSTVIKSRAGAIRYCADYLKKADQKTVPEGVTLPGRMWGLIGCKPVVLAVVEGHKYNLDLCRDISRVVRRAAKSESSWRSGQDKLVPFTESDAVALLWHDGKRTTPKAIRSAQRLRKIVKAKPSDKGATYIPRDKGRGGVGFTVYGAGAVALEYLERVNRQNRV